MVSAQKTAARALVGLAVKTATLRDAAELIVGAKKAAAAPPLAVPAQPRVLPGSLKGVPSKLPDKKKGKKRPGVAQPGVAQPPAFPAAKVANAKTAIRFIKASRALNRNRKAAIVKAAAMYQTAFKSGNRGHIKKATAHLATVLTLAKMEKSAAIGTVLASLLPWLLRYGHKALTATRGLGTAALKGGSKALVGAGKGAKAILGKGAVTKGLGRAANKLTGAATAGPAALGAAGSPFMAALKDPAMLTGLGLGGAGVAGAGSLLGAAPIEQGVLGPAENWPRGGIGRLALGGG
jgi:hypothetical protein